ncbi:porin family protein [Aurantibacter sp.]|uniref:porin family protein n=1 Tax=Aurantibacter sp. TaxID=2807103 RepID=UPI0032677560
MKKLITLAVVAFFGVYQAQAQTDFQFGVTGGLLNNDTNIKASVIGISLFNLDAINKTGYYVGAIADLGITDKFHIQPELTYGKAGDLSFVYLPIMAKFYITRGLNIQAGPQLSFNSNVDEIKSILKDLSNDDDRFSDTLKSTAIEMGVGAGYDITRHLMVQARYSFAITDRYNGPGDALLDVKNTTLNVGVAYKF